MLGNNSLIELLFCHYDRQKIEEIVMLLRKYENGWALNY